MLKTDTSAPGMKLVSVQCIPVIDCGEEVRPQFKGTTKDTTGWSLYLRRESGLVEWVADVADQDTANFFGSALSTHHGIPIEPLDINKMSLI